MVLAATNRPWDLDEAIRRRLEKRVYIPLPNEIGRESLFKINLKSVPLAPNIDFKVLVQKSEGYSGADITSVCRDAAMMPMRRKLMSNDFDLDNITANQEDMNVPITMNDFLEALENIQRSVNQDQLDKFQEWMDQFGAR
jgi:katanin p60 ATPase-containing subunit A1